MRWYRVLLLIVVCTTAHAGAAIADSGPAYERVSPDAIRAADADGLVQVLITFDVPLPLRPSAGEYLGSPAMASRIASARLGVLGALDARQVRIHRSFRHINAMAAQVTPEGLEALRAHPSIRRVDLDEGGSGQLLQALPLTNIDAVRAEGYSGEGITVAVLDSGYDSDHVDLAGDLIGEACFCSGGGGCCPGGGTTATGPGSAEDDHGHGTNVTGVITSAGTITAEGGAPDAEIVAVKVLDSTNRFCCTSDVIAGLDWVIENRSDVDIVNMSLGTSARFTGDCDAANASTQALATAIDTLHENGVSVFAASGNGGSGTQMTAPACIANAISVGAVWDADLGSEPGINCTESSTAPDQVACFSNSNASTDVFAPGAIMSSTGIGGGLSSFRGTSQASPVAAACAALLLEADPMLLPEDIEARLEDSPTFVTDDTNGLSFPRIDCFVALGPESEAMLPAWLAWTVVVGLLAVRAVGQRS